MTRSIHVTIAAAMLLLSPVVLAEPSPVFSGGGNTYRHWDFFHDPDVKGGAKKIEETVTEDGHKSSSSNTITLTRTGQYARVDRMDEKVGLIGSDIFKYNADGALEEIYTPPSKAYSGTSHYRQKAFYSAKGKLAGIKCESSIDNKSWRELETLTVISIDASRLKATQKKQDGKMVEVEYTYDRNGRAATAKHTTEGLMKLDRDASGNVVKATGEATWGRLSITVTYEFDAKGNWTKAAATYDIKSGGKEQKHTRIVSRKITY